ncbi:bifunctional demethylmenaquinone methyltransferase/2-methoxy-6-polyprenyl-1,4-benzoquinol methylase UbiE [Filimonas lacunae]|nr:bifunctional demethylmenaquinone methyltransferase/2-methoxy-6-polyprenyl-1,4-benzoquinol methylase UbiE [Filimonas lacunae]BAV10319.1 2-heptaprenyl-1,4-naphthoquinone methyltransferase MenG [Filimonas lacunae]
MANFAHDHVVPYQDSELEKKQQVANMFDSIAGRYDFMNRFLSAGIDVKWRKKAINLLKPLQPQNVLDVATGTGDVAIMTARMLQPKKITGIDISEGMLEIGREKIVKQGLSAIIDLQKGDSETINFPDNSFDAITVAFGVRNFQNLEKGLKEMLRVLKPGGKLVVLEFSRPKEPVFKTLYNIYMNLIAPGVGKMLAKNKEAYQYLNDSVQAFPEREQLVSIMQGLGYRDTSYKTLTLGICCIYCGSK